MKVLAMYDGTSGEELAADAIATSQYCSTCTYKKGETVKCDKWNNNRWVECGGGIHFFITRYEAETY